MNTTKELCKWLHKPTYVKTSTIVIREIKKYYKKRGISDIDVFPHYTYWNRKHYGVKVPIFRPLTDSWADRKYVQNLEKQKEQYKMFNPAKHKNLSSKELKRITEKNDSDYEANSKILKKGYALKRYLGVFEKLGMGDEFKTYCNFINNIIGDSWEYLLYDVIIDMKCDLQRTEKGEMKLHYNDFTIKDVESKQVCDWFENTKYDYYDLSCEDLEEEAFISFANEKLQELRFPYNFNMRIENNLLIFERAYFEIQRELLYNLDLRNLFKSLSYKGVPSKGLSRYRFKNFCPRIAPIFKDLVPADYQTLEEYVYIIEKLTGINLAICFTKYYAEIVEMAKNSIVRSNLQNLLFGILEEFLDFPNVFSRIHIVQEYMEPILFWDGNLEKKLGSVGSELELLKTSYKKNWNIIKETIANENIALDISFGNIDFETRNKIKKSNNKIYPFIFVDETQLGKYPDDAFATICKRIIEH